MPFVLIVDDKFEGVMADNYNIAGFFITDWHGQTDLIEAYDVVKEVETALEGLQPSAEGKKYVVISNNSELKNVPSGLSPILRRMQRALDAAAVDGKVEEVIVLWKPNKFQEVLARVVSKLPVTKKIVFETFRSPEQLEKWLEANLPLP